MALLVHQQFAVDAFVTLSPQTPDTVCTDGTVGSLLKRREGENLLSQISTHCIQGEATEAVMVCETCAPAGCSVSPPSRLVHQSIQRQFNYEQGTPHSLLNIHT